MRPEETAALVLIIGFVCAMDVERGSVARNARLFPLLLYTRSFLSEPSVNKQEPTTKFQEQWSD